MLLFFVADLLLMTLRPLWDTGDEIASYVLLGGHIIILLSQGAVVFAFFSHTIWFTAGLLGQLLVTIRMSFPLWIMRIFGVVAPWAYRSFGSSVSFDDGLYLFLYTLDLLLALAYWIALLYTVCCMTEKGMYAPYHKESFPSVFAAPTTVGTGMPPIAGAGHDPAM
jgi:hypothetical protein